MEDEVLTVVNEDGVEITRTQWVIEEWKRRRAEDIRLFEEERKTPEYKKMMEELKRKNEAKSNSTS